MKNSLRIAGFTLLAVVLLSACSKVPDHARLIPKDALMVFSVDMDAIGKKMLWTSILNNDAFEKLKQNMPDTSSNDLSGNIAKAGINPLSSYYAYVRETKNNGTDNVIITGLIPITNATAWEAYLKKESPQATITQVGSHKEAVLGSDVYAGWTDNLLILMHINSSGNAAGAAPASNTPNPEYAVAMNNAFSVPTSNSLLGNNRFADLLHAHHDLTLWVNNEQLMNQYMTEGIASQLGGLSLNSSLWKNSAMAMGVDFEKGKVAGTATTYVSDDLKDISKEMGATHADKDFVDRLPKQNLSMLMAMHISPKGVKDMLEKLQLLGLVNVGLASQKLSVDNVLDAITGDMAFTVNNLKLQATLAKDSATGTASAGETKPTADFVFALKINKKENFNGVMQVLLQSANLTAVNNTITIPMGDNDNMYIKYDDHYAVVAHKQSDADGFLQGGFKSEQMPEAAGNVSAHPFAWYTDAQQIFQGIDPHVATTPGDSAMLALTGKLLNNLNIEGGDYSNGSIVYKFDVNFVNKTDNSLFTILEYAIQLGEAQKQAK
jgi:Domain of unknown function (DUF4836)